MDDVSVTRPSLPPFSAFSMVGTFPKRFSAMVQ
jgi:hypothetical protein